MAIAKWQDFFDPNPQNVEQGNYLVFEEVYQTEILDWFRQEDIAKVEKDRFIYSLINFADRCGGFYHFIAYFLAAEYISVFKESEFEAEIVEQILEWSNGLFRHNKNNIDFNKTIAKEAESVSHITNVNRTIASLEKVVLETKRDDVLIPTAKKLLELDANNRVAIAAIRSKLEKAYDRSELWCLISLCVEHKIIPEIAIESLVKLLKQINSGNNAEFEVWVGNTFYYLQKIALGNSDAIVGLIQLVNRLELQYPNDDRYLCELAIETIIIIGKDNNNAIDFLTSFLCSNYSEGLKCLAARALWYIDPGNRTALDICIQLLESEADPFTKKNAALLILKGYLAESIVTKEANKAIASILKRIKNDKDFLWGDYETIPLLCEVSLRNDTAKQTLSEILDICQDNEECMYIASTILKLDSKNQKALNIIYRVIQTKKEDWRRYNAIKSLLELDANNKMAFDALNELLATASHRHTRFEIAKKLALKDASNKLAIQTLSELIYMPRLHGCLSENELALPVLERIDPSKKLAIKALEEFAITTKDQDGLIYIIKHLKRLDPGNDVAQKRLNRIITAVINSMQSYNRNNDTCLMNVAIYWRGIMGSELLPEIVVALKPYLKKQSSPGYDNHDIACGIIWDCAKKMSYRDFHRAWHTPSSDN